MVWIWILVSLLILLVIAIIVVAVLLSQKCKKAFIDAFGSQYGSCFYTAAKKNLCKAHFKQACQIIQQCPSLIHDCIQSILLHHSKTLPTPSTIVSMIQQLCPQVGSCVTDTIDYSTLSASEKQQWLQELTAVSTYILQECS